MKTNIWQKVEEAVAVAAEMPSEKRRAWLEEFCREDLELKSEIESLLAFESEAEGFLENSLAPYAAKILPENDGDYAEKRFGNYRIIREIGRGGMGAVFLAERADGEFNQQVALKIVRQTILDSESENRFRRERQILASLNHPNIARLLDGGVSASGEPFLAMEFIEGETLLEYATKKNLSIDERLALFTKICRGVAFAHRNLIVHRDIKPSNILITKDGEAKLLDFGLAKILDFEADQTQTATAFRALTPAYASPEQLRGEKVTTATDIYSLGVVLYELLTGNRPFDLKTGSFEEIVRHVSTSEPIRPSSFASSKFKVQSSKSGREVQSPKSQVPSPKLEVQNQKSLRGDLDNIVLMSLRKEPERRYQSIEAFAEDVRRHLDGLPVAARPNTFRYRAEKFIKRNTIAVAAASFVFLAIVVGLIASLWQADIARRERDTANREKLKAEQTSQFLSAALAYSDPSAAAAGTSNHRDATINEMLDDFAPRIETELADQDEIRASLQRSVGLAYVSQLRFNEAETYLNHALETQSKIYGENHQESAYTLSGLADVQAAKGDYAAAEKTLQKVIAIYHARPPTDPIHIKVFAVKLNELGDTYWTKGDYRAAETAYNEGLSFASQLQGRDREFVADSKAGLGLTRYAQGRLDEATTLLRETVGDYRSLPHTRHKLPLALNYLAQILTWNHESDEALAVLRESKAISLEVFGENNSFYPRSLWLEVYAMCFNGECAEAEKSLNKAEEIYNRYFPDNKVTEANNYDARNIVLTGTRRAAEGETFGRQAVELYQSVTSRGANSITLARIHLAESLTAQKKYDEAEQVLLEAFRDASEVQGAEHWRTKDVAGHLVSLYEILGRSESAQLYK